MVSSHKLDVHLSPEHRPLFSTFKRATLVNIVVQFLCEFSNSKEEKKKRNGIKTCVADVNIIVIKSFYTNTITHTSSYTNTDNKKISVYTEIKRKTKHVKHA